MLVQVRVWDVVNGRCLGLSSGHAGSVTALSFSRKQPGKLLVSGGADKLLKVRHAVLGEERVPGCLVPGSLRMHLHWVPCG